MATERFHPCFAEDLRAACNYYDNISPDLGRGFRSVVRAAIATVNARPESFAKVGGDYRGALVHRFPYVIVYIADARFTTFYGIRHAASDRGDWFSRAMPRS